jgi:hypothetical protein
MLRKIRLLRRGRIIPTSPCINSTFPCIASRSGRIKPFLARCSNRDRQGGFQRVRLRALLRCWTRCRPGRRKLTFGEHKAQTCGGSGLHSRKLEAP